MYGVLVCAVVVDIVLLVHTTHTEYTPPPPTSSGLLSSWTDRANTHTQETQETQGGGAKAAAGPGRAVDFPPSSDLITVHVRWLTRFHSLNSPPSSFPWIYSICTPYYSSVGSRMTLYTIVHDCNDQSSSTHNTPQTYHTYYPYKVHTALLGGTCPPRFTTSSRFLAFRRDYLWA